MPWVSRVGECRCQSWSHGVGVVLVRRADVQRSHVHSSSTVVVVDRCRSTEGVVKIAQSPPGWHEELVGPPSRESEIDGRGPQYNYTFYSISCLENNKIKTPRWCDPASWRERSALRPTDGPAREAKPPALGQCKSSTLLPLSMNKNQTKQHHIRHVRKWFISACHKNLRRSSASAAYTNNQSAHPLQKPLNQQTTACWPSTNTKMAEADHHHHHYIIISHT